MFKGNRTILRIRTRLSRANWKRIGIGSVIGIPLLLIAFVLTYSHLFGPVQEFAESEQFIVQPDTPVEQVARDLKEQGFIQSKWAFRFAVDEKADGIAIRPGGYVIAKGMDTWSIAKKLVGPPQLAFVTFPPSIRKEQMGEILAEALFWNEEQKHEWLTIATEPDDPAFIEGVYFPDTYLIPSDQSPTQVAARMRGRFTDMFAPYAKEAQDQGLAWTDVLTLASIVDREASKTDKALVAGILWNRLETGMKLQADATLQYIRGTEGKWWPTPTAADKYLESEFNTYKHAGLPPHPINNPTLESVAAVLNPERTNCIFYLHDADHQIHCSLTYAAHKANIDKYLR